MLIPAPHRTIYMGKLCPNSMIIIIVVVIIITIPFSAAEIKTFSILDDDRPVIIFEQFEYGRSGGKASVSATSVSWKSLDLQANVDPDAAGFFLVNETWLPDVMEGLMEKEEFCVLKSPYVRPIFKFTNPVADSAYAGEINVGKEEESILGFGNCQPEFEISMDIRFEMYNVDENGNKNFLPANQTPLPVLYSAFFVIYALFFSIWMWSCRRKRHVVSKIHLVMAALLFFKALKMLCAAEDKLYVASTGTPHGWDIAFYVFGFLKGVVLFTVIVLVGTGWSILKPYLQDREKKVLMFVIPLQILENVVVVMIGEISPADRSWLTWHQAFLIIDVVCCLAVFLPIRWSVQALKEAAATDDKAGRILVKLRLFRHFYAVVMAYLYFTRIVVPATWAAMHKGSSWSKAAADEGASFGFYIFMFYRFRPEEKNPYIAVSGGDDDGKELLQGDESFQSNP